MADRARSFDRLDARRREQTPQALARLAVIGLFIGLWFVLWLLRIPMPLPFLVLLFVEALLFFVYWRAVFLLPSTRAVGLAHYAMLGAEIIFHTTMVYFLGTVSWLGAFAYVFGLIFANTFLDLRRGLVYTGGASLAFVALILLEATGTIPHQVYLEQGPLRYMDPRFVATTAIGGIGVFFSIYAWVNWVGHQLRQERDVAVRAQDGLLQARAELQRANAELEERVSARTAELEQANVALRESETQFRTLAETMMAAVVIVRDKHILYVNQAIEAVTGYSREELLRMDFQDVIHPDSRKLVQGRSGSRERGEGVAPRFELKILAKNGETRWLDVGSNVIEFEGSAAVLATAFDVTERKRTEEALRESESKFRTLAETMSVAVFILQGAKMRYVNSGAETLSGYTREELLTMNFWDTVHPDTQEAMRERGLAQQRGEPVPEEQEVKIITKTGQERWVEFRVSTFMFEGKPAILGSAFDVTERKRAEQALRESEERYRWLIEAAPYAIVIVNDEGRMVMVNAETEKLFGYPRNDLLNKPLEMLVPERFRDAHLGHRAGYLGKARTRSMGTDLVDLVGRRNDGSEFPVDINLSPLETDSGILITATIRDITERKRTEEALREQARRDPLTGLLNRRAGFAAIEERFEAMTGASGRLAVLVLDIDRFKGINDTFGHETGDAALIRFAELLAGLAGEEGVVCRMGGDEFEIGLEGAGLQEAFQFAEEVRTSLRRSLDAWGEEPCPQFTVSIGIACYPEDDETIADLARRADRAMYAAKAAGGDATHSWRQLPSRRAA